MRGIRIAEKTPVFFLINSFGIQFRRSRGHGDSAELFEGGFEVFDPSTRTAGWPWVLGRGPFGLRLRARRRPERSEPRDDDFLGKDVGIGKVVGLFEAFVPEPGDVEAGFVANRKIRINRPDRPSAGRCKCQSRRFDGIFGGSNSASVRRAYLACRFLPGPVEACEA